MDKKLDRVDYERLMSQAAEEEPVIRGILSSQRDDCVDYGEEYRKQTGKDLETGEIAVQ